MDLSYDYSFVMTMTIIMIRLTILVGGPCGVQPVYGCPLSFAERVWAEPDTGESGVGWF